MKGCRNERKKALVVSGLALLATALYQVSWAAPSGGSAMRLVTREVSLGKFPPGAIANNWAVSSDNRRVAFAVKRDDKQFVVMDGKEGKEYHEIGDGQTLVFSPDSKRLMYWARRGSKWLMVVDGVEGKEYDGFVGGPGFDGPTSFHTLMRRGDEILRVEVEIVEP